MARHCHRYFCQATQHRIKQIKAQPLTVWTPDHLKCRTIGGARFNQQTQAERNTQEECSPQPAGETIDFHETHQTLYKGKKADVERNGLNKSTKETWNQKQTKAASTPFKPPLTSSRCFCWCLWVRSCRASQRRAQTACSSLWRCASSLLRSTGSEGGRVCYRHQRQKPESNVNLGESQLLTSIPVSTTLHSKLHLFAPMTIKLYCDCGDDELKNKTDPSVWWESQTSRTTVLLNL